MEISLQEKEKNNMNKQKSDKSSRPCSWGNNRASVSGQQPYTSTPYKRKHFVK